MKSILDLKVMGMLTEERHQKILDLINEQQTVTLKELKDHLNVSESTVRRDLSKLEEEDRLVRVHGGAKRNMVLDYEPSINEKTFKNSQEKDSIAKYAASLVNKKDTIYLDAGTTTYKMIPYLKNKDITVITNGVQTANTLIDMAIETLLLGGKVKERTKAIIGSIALKQLEQYRFSKVFLGINGVDVEYGLTTPDSEEAVIKRTAMNLSNSVYFLADSSKFNKVSFCKVGDLEGQKIITDQLSEQMKRHFKKYDAIKEVK